MPATRRQIVNIGSMVMAVIAIGLAIYFIVYVWGRVGKPQDRSDGTHVSNRTEDWAYYYAAAQAMRDGQDIYTVQAPERGRAGYIYPPLLAFLYQPLARLGFLPGARASLLIDLVALAAALAVAARALLERMALDRTWQKVLTIAVFAALLSTDKIKGEFQMLQCNGLVALGMALGLWLLDRKPLLAGAALGFAINIKYQALGLVFFLIFRKRWKALAGSLAGTAFWAFLPALSLGFTRDAQYLVRGFSGVLRLVGFKVATDVANIEPLSGTYSLSITSASARLMEHQGWSLSPFIPAAAVAVLWLLALAALYRSQRTAVLIWPPARGQGTPPWSIVVGLEWIAVIASVLAFSPETNSRHLVLTTLINVLGIVLAIETRGRARWLSLAGLLVLWMGLNLPPGRLGNDSAQSAVAVWHGIGGPTWAALAACGLLTWAGLLRANSAPNPQAAAVLTTHPDVTPLQT